MSAAASWRAARLSRRSAPCPPSAAHPPAAAAPSPSPQGKDRAGHQPPSRGFNHDPIERPDDRRRLLGEE